MDTLKISYSNSVQLEDALYQTGFTNVLTLSASRAFPAPIATEDIKRRGVLDTAVELVQIAQVEFTVLVQDSIKNVLHNLRLHDTVNFTFDGLDYYAYQRVAVNSTYLPDMNLFEVEISVPYEVSTYRESNTNDSLTVL